MLIDMKTKAILGAQVALLVGLSSAQPVIKTGACPEFTRYKAPTTENWGSFPFKPTGFDVGNLQEALPPEKSINCIQVPTGLRAELWASEKLPGVTPTLNYLQHFTFDERGRMWAVEPRSYPNTIRSATNSVTDQKFQGGLDRILILEDTDGDKVADKVKVFKDGLNLPQSILVVKGGVIVTMTPYVAYFPNNNDVAGTPVILFSGMGPSGNFDTHGTIGSLMYGLDNWIYGHTGYNGCTATATGISVPCGGGRVWRFRHTALGHSETKFESWTTGKANAWGVGQMEDGQIFQSAATQPSPYFQHSIRQGAAAVDITAGKGGNNLFYPITGDRYLWEGGSTAKNTQTGWYQSLSTAVSGMDFYTSRLLPQKYWNRFAFTCDGANKLCNQDSMVVSTNGDNTGSTWRAVRMPGPERSNILVGSDAWVAPVQAMTGPDGAVWVLDWYNFLFLHNPALPGGNCMDGIPNNGCAWNNHLREKKYSRIYRVTPADGKTEAVLNLTNASVAQLVAALGNPNMLWRLHAQRLLIEKGFTADIGTQLEAILKDDHGVDEVGNNPRVIHSLWTLHGMGQFTADAARWSPVLADLLKHPAWGVRRNALMAMTRNTASAQAIDAACSINDTHGHVRLQVLVALAGISAKPAGMKAMWDTYKNVDGTTGDNAHAANAFTAAGSGLTSDATRPCEPVLYPGAPYIPTTVGVERAVSQPRSDLRFSYTPDGFQLLSHGQLPSGELLVWDAHGREVFRSGYEAGAQRWSQSRAQGLSKGVHVYAFRGVDGTRIQGRLGMAGGF